MGRPSLSINFEQKEYDNRVPLNTGNSLRNVLLCNSVVHKYHVSMIQAYGFLGYKANACYCTEYCNSNTR